MPDPFPGTAGAPEGLGQYNMIELDAYIDRVKKLPPAPQLLPELITLLNEPDVDSDRVVRLITYDPSLTAGVLQLCNSASQAPSQPVLHLDEAVVRLGFANIYRLVATTLGARTLTGNRNGKNTDRLWRHSVTTAIAAQLIAREMGDDANVVFTAALLHDIGKIILTDASPDAYSELVREVEDNQFSLLEAEKRVLGVQHSEIGGRLFARWKFPLNIVSAVWFHHYPAAAKPYERWAAYVYLGDLVASLIGYGSGRHALGLRGREEALGILHLDVNSLAGFMGATGTELAALSSLFQAGHCA